MLTQRLDLRSGDPPWDDDAWDIPPPNPLPSSRCDLAIVGGGITGSIIAERLSAEGHSVVVLDRRPPGMGSTAASTAQIMWGMDVPLGTLAASIGEDQAARRWRRIYAAVRRFGNRLDALSVAASKIECPTIYLQGSKLDADGLREEAELHRKHDLPSACFEADAVAQRFGIAPIAAIVSDGGFSIDPVAAALGLLERARERGAQLCYPQDVTALSPLQDGVRLELAGGNELEAGQVILATGYECARLFLPPQFALLSTFVMATAPGIAPLWNEQAMIWEAADPYLYFRADPDGRVVVGGEDEDTADPDRRAALTPAKAGVIAAAASQRLGGKPLTVDRTWSATFGSSPDGLPAIGPVANFDRVWLAAGFGGNGIAFSALAAEILAREIAGRRDPDAGCFDPYRFS